MKILCGASARVRALLLAALSPATAERADAPHRIFTQTTSHDGTRIAYELTGHGPAVILVDGALCSREFGPARKLSELLSKHFTVYAYDRRGRGESGGGGVYTKQREIEDLAALVKAAGGKASLVGLSSGGALALEAAASGIGVDKVVAYEPPFVHAAGQGQGPRYETELRQLVAAGDRSGAVKYFMTTMVGAPAVAVVMMRLMPWVWRKLKAVAHTLPHDAAVMGNFEVPVDRYAGFDVDLLVMHGSKTDPRLAAAATTLARVVPGAQHRVLAGQTHNVSPAVLCPAVAAFLGT